MKIRLLIMLALVLTMFAVSAKAQPTPPGCNGLSNGPITKIVANPNNPACPITVKFCYDCGDPVDGKAFTYYITEITCACPLPNASYDWIDDALTELAYLQFLCPEFLDITPCGTQPYKDVQITKPACWKIRNTGGQYIYEACDPLCTALCVFTFRYCYETGSQTMMFYMISSSVEGVTNAPYCNDCVLWHLEDIPLPSLGQTSDCYHVCE